MNIIFFIALFVCGCRCVKVVLGGHVFDGVVNLCFGQVWMRGQARHHGPQVASPARPMSPLG